MHDDGRYGWWGKGPPARAETSPRDVVKGQLTLWKVRSELSYSSVLRKRV